jgi:hypothetical protein
MTKSKCKKIVHEAYDELGDLLGNHLNFHLTAYADDVTVFVTDKQDVEKFHSVFDVCTEPSGLNRDKPTGLICGPWRQSNRPKGHYQWATDGTKFLGVWLGNDPVEERRQVESDLIALVQWERVAGRLSLRGRVRVANQFIASKICTALRADRHGGHQGAAERTGEFYLGRGEALGRRCDALRPGAPGEFGAG